MKAFIFSLILFCGAATTQAQITTDSAGKPVPAAPATTTTTTTTVITTEAAKPASPPVVVTSPPPAPPAAPAYYPQEKKHINVNKLRFGAFVAPNISWMKPTAATDDSKQFNTKSNGSKLGFTYGLMADYFFAENYGLVSGISINSTGGKMLATRISTSPDSNSVHKADFDYRLQYVDIPLALKLRTDNIQGFRFFGQLGITVGFNVSKKADYSVTYSDASGNEQTVTDSKIKLTGSLTNIAPVMLQMNIGAGGEYPINNKLSVYFGLFFNNGFAPDATNPENFDNTKLGYRGSFRDANTRLNNFALRLGLFF